LLNNKYESEEEEEEALENRYKFSITFTEDDGTANKC
jgi:hypothetical protein